MPKEASFDNIDIYIYGGDHRPPHIHAYYKGDEVLIIIETRKIYAGSIPNKQLKKVQEWLD